MAAKELRQNNYWLSYVDEAQTKADRLERLRTRDQLLRSLTAADLQALARQYLVNSRMQRVRVVSDKLNGAAAAPVAATAN